MESLAVSAPAVNQVVVSIPFTFGEQDARNGIPCVPEMYWTHIDDQRDYCAGYRTIAGETITTRLFLGAVGKIVNGQIDLRVAPPLVGVFSESEAEVLLEDLMRRPAPDQLPLDGVLQDVIDFGAELQELEDDMADREFWAGGRW